MAIAVDCHSKGLLETHVFAAAMRSSRNVKKWESTV
jgi:hypothetical protein